MIETRHLTKRYGEAVVVDDVSITLPASGITSIIGPNGAGKSSLLAIISRLLPMSEGSVTIDGLDLARTPSHELAKRLSVLRQENHIAARLTVRDLVAFGRYPHSKGRLTVEDAGHIDRAIGYLALDDVTHRFLDELSGGQRQRAFVAMVLCQDTRYVLLDEPLNHLDIKHAVAMMKLLRRAADELGKIIIIVSHDLNFAARYSDHIIAMKRGTIFCQGAAEEVMTSSRLTALYDVDVNLVEHGGRLMCDFYGSPTEIV
jgi:iron complex transport system ATP-binding protein